MRRFSLIRFCIVVALGFSSRSLVVAEEKASPGSVVDENKEKVAEVVENVAENVKEGTAKVTEGAAEAAQEAKNVAQKVVGDVADAMPDIPEEPVKEVKASIKSVKLKKEKSEESSDSKLDGLKDKIKSLVDKVKSVDKSALKKIAAGAIGVWGVSIAVGWLTKGGGAASDVAAPEKKRR